MRRFVLPGDSRQRLRCSGFCVCAVSVLSSSVALGDIITVDLATYPDTGATVPQNAIISDEWRSIGILFGARGASETILQQGSVFSIVGGSGSNPATRFYFFTPDVFGAVGIFSFVKPDTTIPMDATTFQIDPAFDAGGESVTLIGFDKFGGAVTQQTATGTDPDVPMSISGLFRTVELRTFGNPGIGFQNTIQFDSVPELSSFTLLGLTAPGCCGMRLRRRRRRLAA